jgi:hypothetical protein
MSEARFAKDSIQLVDYFDVIYADYNFGTKARYYCPKGKFF